MACASGACLPASAFFARVLAGRTLSDCRLTFCLRTEDIRHSNKEIRYLSNYIITIQTEYANAAFQLFAWLLVFNLVFICCLRNKKINNEPDAYIVKSESDTPETKI